MTESSRSDAPGAERPSPSSGSAAALLRKLKSYWLAYKRIRRSASYVRAGQWLVRDREPSSGSGSVGPKAKGASPSRTRKSKGSTTR